jgi:hypothetical protein
LIASLNDESGNFRLSKAQLDYLGLSHSQLISLVLRKHTIIKDYFGSGIGLHMQYQDSKLAEKVILQMMDHGEVCLPIHDSFIVCEHAENLLQKVMLHEYQQLFGSSVKVRLDKGYKGIGLSQPRQTLLKPTLTMDDLIKSYQNHIESYSVVLGYFNSWESRNFSVEEIENRLCCLNENRSLAKDFGHSFPPYLSIQWHT